MRGNTKRSQGFRAYFTSFVHASWDQTDSAFQYFTIFLTNLSSSVWLTTTAAHSLDATDSAWFCVHATSYNSAHIKPDLETFQQPFFFITCFLLLLLPLLPLYLLLFPPLHHFHPRSAFVDSCPERGCAVCARLCAILLHFHIFLTGFCLEGWGLHVAPVRQPGGCHGQTRCCRITAFWQKPMNQIW